jgi:hypothetical protein
MPWEDLLKIQELDPGSSFTVEIPKVTTAQRPTRTERADSFTTLPHQPIKVS